MTLTIPALDHGKIRVFSVTSAGHDDLLEKTPPALQAAFGTADLDPDFIDVFDVESLDGMTVSAFIEQGYDLKPDPADATMLRGLRGIVVLIMSRATGEAETNLSLASGISHVTTLGEGAKLSVASQIETPSADGIIAGPPPRTRKSDARIGGMVATIALVVMMLLVGLMIWVGG